MADKTSSITLLLKRHATGDAAAMDELAQLVYHRMRVLARKHLSKNSQQTLQPTALVNEVFMRLLEAKEIGTDGRQQFFCLASTAMRRILIDHARKRNANKRGGGAIRLSLDENIPAPDAGVDILSLDDALTRLAAIEPRLEQVVELKCFAGFSTDEIASILGTSPGTVKRDWAKAKLWLAQVFKEAA